jgi:hypothetical protein
MFNSYLMHQRVRVEIRLLYSFVHHFAPCVSSSKINYYIKKKHYIMSAYSKEKANIAFMFNNLESYSLKEIK